MENAKMDIISESLVDKYLSKSNNLDNYVAQEKAINILFEKFPKNNSIEDILLKVSCLNDFYSTNIFDTYTVSKHILDLSIDNRLFENDLSLVHDIAQVKMKNEKMINFYSFASKYCSHHNKEYFPIYDYFVYKVLMAYRKQDSFYQFIGSDLKDYKKFVVIINEFKKYYDLTKFSLREIDIFLWLVGKEKFPRNSKPIKL